MPPLIVISPISLTDIPNTLEFNELISEVPQIVYSFEPHFYTDVSATQVKSHVHSESFIQQSVSNTSTTTSVSLPQSVPAQSVCKESVISSNPTISTLNPNVDAFIPRPSEPAVATSSQSTSLVLSHQYQRLAASSIAPTYMNVPRTPNVNTSLNEQLAPTESTCRSPNLEQGLLSLANSLAQQMSLSRLPPPEPNIFYGDPLKYPGWKVAFQGLFEQRQIPVTERIHYLKKYIGGPVKDVIGNYFLVTTSDSFEEAKSLLDQRYGDPFIISSAFRNKLDKWPKIASRYGPGLQKFSDFLRQCYNAMRNIGNLDVLNDSRENQRMLSRLPDWLVVRWGRIVVQKKEESNQHPPFKDYISKETKIACDPVISIQAV